MTILLTTKVRVCYQKLIFLFLKLNICCGYSKEPSQWDGSFKCTKQMLKLMGKKIFTLKILLSKYVFIFTHGLDVDHLLTPLLSPHELQYFVLCQMFFHRVMDPLNQHTVETWPTKEVCHCRTVSKWINSPARLGLYTWKTKGNIFYIVLYTKGHFIWNLLLKLFQSDWFFQPSSILIHYA